MTKGYSPKKGGSISLVLVFVGLILFFFGEGLNLTVIGLPEGITAQILGVILMVIGAGMRL